MDRDAAEQFLESGGADARAHSRATLLEHLRGTFDLLRSWHCRDEVCLAGLYHSVYGTATFLTGLGRLVERELVREVIGVEAERLVYLFSHLDGAERYRCMEGAAREVLADWAKYGIRRPAEADRVFRIQYRKEETTIILRDLCDLAHVSVANALEQDRRIPRAYQLHDVQSMEVMYPLLNPRAAADFEAWETRKRSRL